MRAVLSAGGGKACAGGGLDPPAVVPPVPSWSRVAILFSNVAAADAFSIKFVIASRSTTWSHACFISFL